MNIRIESIFFCFFLSFLALSNASMSRSKLREPTRSTKLLPSNTFAGESTTSCLKDLFNILFKLPQENNPKKAQEQVKAFYDNALCVTQWAETNPTEVASFSELILRLSIFPDDDESGKQEEAKRQIRELVNKVKREISKYRQFLQTLKEYKEDKFVDEVEEEQQSMDQNLLACLTYHFKASCSFNMPEQIKEQKEIIKYGLRLNSACLAVTSKRSKYLLNMLLKVFKQIAQSPDSEGIYQLASQISQYYRQKYEFSNGIHINREIRNLFVKVFKPEPRDPEIKITRTEFNGVKVIVLEPVRKEHQPRPGLMFFHGGGLALRNAEEYLTQTHYLSKNLGAVIISVDYRKSPEYQFPAQIEDCLKATEYLLENSHKFNVDPNRIGLIGDEAGGNLASSVALMLHHKRKSGLKVQVLLYPLIEMYNSQLHSYDYMQEKNPLHEYKIKFPLLFEDLDTLFKEHLFRKDAFDSTSHERITPHVLYSRLSRYCQNYVTNTSKDRIKIGNQKQFKEFMMNQYICPLGENTLRGLPATLLIYGECDSRQREEMIFGNALQENSVDVENKVIQGGFYYVIDFLNYLKVSNDMMEAIIEYLKRKL